jgi:hypothetical protein
MPTVISGLFRGRSRPDSRRGRISLLGSVILAAVPVAFGLIRAASTGDDVRYLWLAGAAIVGSMATMRSGRSGAAHVSIGRALGAVAAGSACAAAAAMLMGTTAGLGLAVVALGFGLCTGTSAVLAALARQTRPL